MDTTPELTTLAGGPAIAIRARLTIPELPGFFGAAFGELAACAADQATGMPFARYHTIEPGKVDVEAVLAVRAPVETSGRVRLIETASGPAVQVVHHGPYEQLGPAYSAIDQWIAEHHRARSGPVQEMYLNEPTVPPVDLVTVVIQPLAAGP